MKKFKTLLCCLICLMLILTSISFAFLTFHAAAGDTVYCQFPEGFTTPHCYVWEGDLNNNWPGQSMTHVDGNIYKFVLPGNYSNIIFNNGSNQNQSADLKVDSGKMFVYGQSTWVEYTGDEYEEPKPPKPPIENIVPNPSFEQDGGWNYGAFFRTTERAHTGTYSAKTNVRGAAAATIFTQQLTVVPNTDYLYSAYFYKADNSMWAYIDMNDRGGELQIWDMSSGGSWQHVAGVWNSGTATSITVRAVVEQNHSISSVPGYSGITGDVWIDDITLTPVDYSEYSEAPPALTGTSQSYTIKNSETQVTITRDGIKEYITELKYIKAGTNWSNWVDGGTEVPMLSKVNGSDINWQYSSVDVDTSNPLTGTGGEACHTITFTYTSASPALTLKSYYKIYTTGPLYHYSEIINNTSGNITINTGDAIPGDAIFNIPDNVTVWRFNRSRYNNGLDGFFTTGLFKSKVGKDLTIRNIVENDWLTSTGSLPFEMLQSDDGQGLYIGYDWGYGNMLIRTQDNKNKLRFSADLGFATENITRTPGEKFLVPGVFYGPYTGSVDYGSNLMKKWFYNHLMTETLRENANEPLIEYHIEAYSESRLKDYLNKNDVGNWGIELTKMDWLWTLPDPLPNPSNPFNPPLEQQWLPDPNKWPNGMTYGQIVKQKYPELKVSLYYRNTYNGVDIGTKSGQQEQINALKYRMDNWGIDYWRSDFDVLKPNNYTNEEGLMNILDTMIADRSNFRYECCSAGGALKDFQLLKRMTFITMEDSGGAMNHRMAYYSNSYMINPVQLKFDLGYDFAATGEEANAISQNPTKWYYYAARTAMLGAMMVQSGNWEIPQTQKEAMQQSWSLYKEKQRPILKGGNVYHILPMPDGVNWDGMQFYNNEIEKGSVFLFRPINSGTDGSSKTIKLDGLKENGIYKLTFQDRTNLNTQMSGKDLMQTGITVSGMNSSLDSEIIWIEKVGEDPIPTTPISTTIEQTTTILPTTTTTQITTIQTTTIDQTTTIIPTTTLIPTTISTDPITTTWSTQTYYYKMGDVRMDGDVTIGDATEMQKALAKMITFNEIQSVLAVTTNGANTEHSNQYTISDVTEIQKWLAKLEANEHIETEMAFTLILP